MIKIDEEYIGKVFDRLTLTGRYDYTKGKHKRYECICVCGEIVWVDIYSLKNGVTKSCGCLKKDRFKNKEKDPIHEGTKIGSLLVLHRIYDNSKSTNYLCRCDCGKEKIIPKNHLLNGTISCGCKKCDRRERKPLSIGQRFGRLVIEKEEPEKVNNRYYYVCKCDCGNICKVNKLYLLSGKINSCGCLRKETSSKTGKKYGPIYGKELGKLIVDRSLEYRDLSVIRDYIHPDYLDECSLLEDHTLSTKSRIHVKCTKCGKPSSIIIGNYIKSNGDLKRSLESFLCVQCSSKHSTWEDIIIQKIREFYSGPIEQNKIGLIGNKLELDIFLPELDLGIEVNSIYWHSTLGEGLVSLKQKDYHYNKWKMCLDNNIHLLSIFETDLLLNYNKVISIIRDFIVPKTKVSARETVIKEITIQQREDFLNTYHFDGDSKLSKVSLGLFSKDNNLLSVMSFGYLRGQNKDHVLHNYYEITRYATVTGYTIIGGASKLLTYFEKRYNPKKVISYSDNDFFTGSIYDRLGFKKVSGGESSIDYQWATMSGSDILSRYRTQPNKLEKLSRKLNCVLDTSNKTEDECMVELGYCKLYRCGNSKWEKEYNELS